jgi:Putative Ig domain/WD40-like Beta Propeller Repeat
MLKPIVSIVISLALQSPAHLSAQEPSDRPDPTIPASAAYLGQTPPGDSAVVFAPDIISPDSVFAGNATFTLDGREFYFTVTNSRWDHFEIWSTKFVDGRWSIPAKVTFLGDSLNLEEMEPFIAPDGSHLYFNAGTAANTDIWCCEKTGSGWGKPAKLSDMINTPDLEWRPTISKKSTLYTVKNGGVYRSTFQNGQFTRAEKLGCPVKSTGGEGDAFIAPDEDYLIFQSNRSGGLGQADLYISYRKEDGSWTNPKNLGPKINSSEFEFGASITRDGKYLMFSRRQQWLTDVPSKIYWATSDFIERLKHTNYAPYACTQVTSQSCVVGQSLSLSLPDGSFVDDDGDNTLTYSARLDNGNPLPSWLSFNPATRTLSGTPTQVGLIGINIIATDNAGATASTTILLSATATAGSEIRGAYFGQSLPGEMPVLFAPEILRSVSPWVEATDFSPNGALFLLAVGDSSYSSARLYYSHCVDSVWTPFTYAPFTSDFVFSHEPRFGANGVTLTFTGKTATGSQDLWVVRYQDTAWGQPIALPAPINSDAREWRGSSTSDGVVYFGSTRGNPPINQVYRAHRDSSQQWVAEKMGPPINMNAYEGDPCVAPDGHFLIFYSARSGVSADLYVSFRDANGGWGEPIPLGPEFNTANDEYGAHLTTDGKYLFFTRHTPTGNEIYWVAASAIEKLKP